MSWKTCVCDDDPAAWTGNATGLNLGAPGLEAMAQQWTSALQEPAEQASALFHRISHIPFAISDPHERTDPAALSRLASGDAYFKATLWVHLLRLCDIPARMRWVELNPLLLTRGLWDFVRHTGMPLFYPLTEVWLAGRWLTTDAYIVDPDLFLAVRGRLLQKGESSGFFVHRDGRCDWDAQGDAYQRFSPDDPPSWPLRDLGCFHSHAHFLRSCQVSMPETQATTMAYAHQARHMNEAFVRLRSGV